MKNLGFKFRPPCKKYFSVLEKKCCFPDLKGCIISLFLLLLLSLRFSTGSRNKRAL